MVTFVSQFYHIGTILQKQNIIWKY